MRSLPLYAKLALIGVLVLGALQVLDDQPVGQPEATLQTIVATPAREFAATINPAGDKIYFNRSSETGAWHIWVSDFDGGEIDRAEPVSFSDPRYDDLDPFVSRSGDRLYFSSDRPLPGSNSSERTPDTNTWYAPWQGDGWGVPIYAGDAVNSGLSETYVSESAHGELIFARFGEGRGRARPAYLYIAERTETGFAEPVQVQAQPEGLRLTNPAISADGNLIVATGTDGGGPNLYVSRKGREGAWSPFTKLPSPVNIDGAGQFAPYISNDSDWLYFASDRNSNEEERNDDIFRVPLSGLLSN